MKNKLIILLVTGIVLVIGITIGYVIKPTIPIGGATNQFPTALNNWQVGDVIESNWANSLEIKIGIDNSAVTNSIDYLMRNGTDTISILGTITTGTWQGTAITDTYISSAATWNAKWDSLSDMPLAQGNIYIGNASNNPIATSSLYIDTAGNVGIGTTTLTTDLDVWDTASTTIKIGDATHSGCIILGDSDSGGISYITVLDGVLSATDTKPAICK